MLRLLRRLLGWDTGSGPFDFECLEQPIHPRSSTASLFTSKPNKTSIATQDAGPSAKAGAKPTAQAQKAPPAKGKANPVPKKKTASEILDNPELSLNGPQDAGFDPYNTGAFTRSQSWDRISKQRTGR